MKAILQRWNFMRILRLALGLIIAVQGIAAGEMVTAILGFLFAGMALANIGCCGANGCAVDFKNSKNEKEILYEEVDIKK
jgi:hypothetical protein